jgi:hypothetical protein
MVSVFFTGRYLVLGELSVFCRPTSKFIRMLRSSRKTMVASKRYEELYWFRPEPYVYFER